MAKKKVSKLSKKIAKKPVKKTKRATKEPTLAKRLRKVLTPEQRDRLVTALAKPKAETPAPQSYDRRSPPQSYDSQSQSNGTLADPYYDSCRNRPYTGGINDS